MKRMILTAIATIFFFSCNKNPGSPAGKTKAKIQSSSDAHDFSFHGTRYYDSLGMLHNQILASFQKVSNGNRPRTPEHFRQFLSKYMREKTGKTIELPTNMPPEKVLEIIKRFLKGDFGTTDKPEVESYLQGIFDRVTATNSFDTVLYKQHFLELENQIRTDKCLCFSDKNMLLATAAIARHSGCYWLNFYENQNANSQNSRLGVFKKLLKAIGVTLADATGVAYNYFSNKPMDEWVENAAWFSEVGYWSIDHLQNGDSYK